MTRLFHRLGFHGANWVPFWRTGNIWIRCRVCGSRRMLSFAEGSEVVGPIEGES